MSTHTIKKTANVFETRRLAVICFGRSMVFIAAVFPLGWLARGGL